jgi:hypothetical protein
MSEVINYRCRWMDAAGVALVERRHDRRAFGFWPVYHWISVANFPSMKEAVEWVVKQSSSSPTDSENEK